MFGVNCFGSQYIRVLSVGFEWYCHSLVNLMEIFVSSSSCVGLYQFYGGIPFCMLLRGVRQFIVVSSLLVLRS